MSERPSSGRRKTRRRISRSAEFERVYRKGRSKANQYLVLYAFKRSNEDDESARLGLSVSRRVGGAVERSKVKRLLREAFWEEAQGLPSECDYVVVARPDVRTLAERDGLTGIQKALTELVIAIGGKPKDGKAVEQEPDRDEELR